MNAKTETVKTYQVPIHVLLEPAWDVPARLVLEAEECSRCHGSGVIGMASHERECTKCFGLGRPVLSAFIGSLIS